MSETRTVWNPFSHRYVEVPFPAASPRPAAPDATGGELREAIARALDGKCIDVGLHLKAASTHRRTTRGKTR